MTDTTKKKIIKWFWILVTCPVALVLLLILMVWMFADIPSFKELENPESNVATQVIAEGGQVLATFHIENRTFVTFVGSWNDGRIFVRIGHYDDRIQYDTRHIGT